MKQAQTVIGILMSVVAAVCDGDEPPLMPLESVVAINVLLKVNDRIADAALRANQRLRSANAEGFTFDATHIPHISVLHAYVSRDDLPAIYAEVDRVTREFPLEAFDLAADGYDVSPWEEGALINITIEKSAALGRFQKALVQVLAPYLIARGDEHAFARTKHSSQIDEMTIDYVATFVTKKVGDTYKPHITVGLTATEDASRWESEQFSRIVFQPADIAIYQLGNRGTARRELHVAPRVPGSRAP